ncbi:MAG: hypothetical protein PWP19_714, partial [Thermococcaceae archaeon]|nr:hypothetical protein [Thermococcaceae archaeon]
MEDISSGFYRRISTGVKGLDDLIGGGLIPGRVYVVTGPPGSGKTTLGIQFLVEGAKNWEKGVYISLVDDPKTIIQDMFHYKFNLLSFDTVRISCGVSGLSYWQYFRKRRGNMKSETIIY